MPTFKTICRAEQLPVFPNRRDPTCEGGHPRVIKACFTPGTGATIDTVIDINPAKRGRHLAAAGLRVSLPQEAVPRLRDGADIFVMNSNCLGEIQDRSAH